MSKDRKSKSAAFKIIREIAEDLRTSDEVYFNKRTLIETTNNNLSNPFTGESSPSTQFHSEEFNFKSNDINFPRAISNLRKSISLGDLSTNETFIHSFSASQKSSTVSNSIFTMAFDIKYFHKQITSHLPPFTENRDDLKKFVEAVEDLFSTLPETAEEKIPSLLKFLTRYHLSGVTYNLIAEKSIKTVEEFKTELVKACSTKPNLETILSKLASTKQKSNEAFDRFAIRIKRFEFDLFQAYSSNNVESFDNESIKKMVSQTLFTAFVRNLTSKANQLCISQNLKNIEECVLFLQKHDTFLPTTSDSDDEIEKLQSKIKHVELQSKIPNQRSRNQDDSRNLARSNNFRSNDNFQRNLNFRQNAFEFRPNISRRVYVNAFDNNYQPQFNPNRNNSQLRYGNQFPNSNSFNSNRNFNPNGNFNSNRNFNSNFPTNRQSFNGYPQNAFRNNNSFGNSYPPRNFQSGYNNNSPNGFQTQNSQGIYRNASNSNVNNSPQNTTTSNGNIRSGLQAITTTPHANNNASLDYDRSMTKN